MFDGFLHALVASLRGSELNSALTDDETTVFDTVNLAFAIDGPRGLVAPVIRSAEGLSVTELADERRRLTQAAIEGTLGMADLEGATFTVSNLGTFGVEYFTPILTLPQVGILGIGAWNRVTGALPVSLTFDHRAVDGAGAARFLQNLISTDMYAIKEPTL